MSGEPFRLALIGSGAGSTAAEIMDAAGTMINARISLVISNNSRSGVLAAAAARDLPTVHLSAKTHPDPDDLDAAMDTALHEAGTDLVVLAGYLRKVGSRVLRRYQGRIVNTHPALLPDYGGKGMYGDRVHAAVLAGGTTVTGASVHLVTAEYDQGPVLAQASVPILADDDVASLRTRVQAAEKNLLLHWLREFDHRG